MVLPTSRFRFTDLLIHNGKSTYGIISGIDDIKNPPDNEIDMHRVDMEEAGRPDLLAVGFYGTPHLAWVIVMANHPKNPLNWPKTGDVIKIPKKSFVNGLF